MNFRPIGLFLPFIFVFGIKSNAQVVFTDNYPYTDSTELFKLYNEYQIVKHDFTGGFKHLRRIDILEKDNDKYLLPEGSFDVYKWENQTWINKYRLNFHGYNFSSKKFIYNNKIYSYGGYGFWNEHGQIIEFREDKGEWELMPFSKVLPNGIGLNSENGLIIYIENTKLEVDINKKSVTRIKVDFPKRQSDWVIEYKDFAAIFSKPYTIFPKSPDSIYYSELSPLQYTNRSIGSKYFLHVKHNTSTLYDTGLNLIGIDSLENELVDYKLMDITTLETNNNPLVFILFFVGAVFILISYKLTKRKFTRRNPQIRLPQYKSIIELLVNQKNNALTIEQLDTILGISNITQPETLRFKRAKMVKEINQEYFYAHGKDLISRIKDPEDGRRFLYRIL